MLPTQNVVKDPVRWTATATHYIYYFLRKRGNQQYRTYGVTVCRRPFTVGGIPMYKWMPNCPAELMHRSVGDMTSTKYDNVGREVYEICLEDPETCLTLLQL